MEALAAELAAAGVAIARFEFAYMAARRDGGPRRPPPPLPALCDEYRALVASLAAVEGQRLYIGGKSMGGRVASMIADELYATRTISGLVAVGYPFHPPGKPESLRVAHLKELACPALIIQGTRDLLGNPELIPGLHLSRTIGFAWMPDGDHDLKPRQKSGFTQAEHIAAAAREIAQFLGIGAP